MEVFEPPMPVVAVAQWVERRPLTRETGVQNALPLVISLGKIEATIAPSSPSCELVHKFGQFYYVR